MTQILVLVDTSKLQDALQEGEGRWKGQVELQLGQDVEIAV